jgi:DNA-binding CsgD family transcriptional regulator
MARGRWVVIPLFLVLLVGAVILAGRIGDVTTDEQALPGSEAMRGVELVETRFSDGREATDIQPVFRNPSLTVDDPAYREAVTETYAVELLADGAGGVGYLLKERIADPSEFVEAVRRVAGGGTAMDPEVVAQLVARRGRASPLGELTPREREVLELMAEGRSNAAIAQTMVVTEGAVEKHVSNIFGKLGLTTSEGAHRRVLAVLAFLRSA